MLEERVVGVGLGECDLVGVGEVEVVEGEDDGWEVVGRGLEGRSDYGNLGIVSWERAIALERRRVLEQFCLLLGRHSSRGKRAEDCPRRHAVGDGLLGAQE